MKIEKIKEYISSLKSNDYNELMRRTSRPSIFLYDTVIEYGSMNILEIGTFKGNNTMYLGAAADENGGKVTTINISESEISCAKEHIKKLGLTNVEFILGDSLKVLKNKLQNESFDLVFIDGHHSYNYSYKEFKLVSQNMVKGNVILLDDPAAVHSDSKGDGGVPRTVKEVDATIIYVDCGDNKDSAPIAIKVI